MSETGSTVPNTERDQSGPEMGSAEVGEARPRTPDGGGREEDLGAELADLNRRIDEHLKRLAGA
ncbi:hypothetical protein [Streptomyces litchfieldiae]|uniref:Uncharacterized protein n=1 Tax=Streptomyces litchfieldiae TaxID=3075543 RepID=A0ABU2MLU7_9ACTN|nr:hypothetical protein [Streptomyces sp. DSM 44938]MDT0342343.1 hypothetical protein [Streptomyces sp. DSM 44938]